MSQQGHGRVLACGYGFAPEDLLAAKGHIADLLKAVRPHEERSSLTPRERILASRALSSLGDLARDQIGAPTVAAFAHANLSAWSALLKVNSIAIRTVAEAGGAASAAANSRHPERSTSSSSSSEVPKASSAAAWTEAVQNSSGLLGTLLAKSHEDDPNQHHAASMEAHIRRRGYRLASALLRSDALPALSRLLAAEQHRGTAPVLDVDGIVFAVWLLVQLLRLSSLRPTEPIWLGQGLGKAQLGPTVLRALAASGVVEHVCKFAVTRLAGQQAGGGTAGLGTRKLNKYLDIVMQLLRWMTRCAAEALEETGEVAADARAVLSAPCYQYLVHLHVVSQLHALDGGTTYGLPHDKLLPPVRAMGAEAGRGEPIMLEYRGLQTAFDLWDTGVREEGTYLYTLEGRRTVLDLLLRMACAILDSADYFAAGGRGSSSSSGGAGGRDSGMGASEAGSSQGQPPAAPGPGPAAVLWDVDQRNSLRALLCALDIDTGLAERDNSADSSSSGDSGSGRGGSGNGASGGNGENGRGSGGSGMDASGSGAGAGGSGGGGACLGSKHDGREGAGAGPAVANSAGPAFARPWRWWPLAVRTVRALMDEGVDHALPALCAVMASLWEAAEPPESGASRPAASMPRPARSWLPAALSAGYLPCLERLMRTVASRNPAILGDRARMVLGLVAAQRLVMLVLHGEERQAAALLVTAVKATAVLAHGGACRWFPFAIYQQIPIAPVLAVKLVTKGSSRGGDLSAQQRELRAKLLRLLTLCMARWLPLCAALLPAAQAEAGAGEGAGEGEEGEPAAHVLLLRTGRRLVRLAGLAQGAAEGRGDARAAESWGRLLAACGGIAAGEGSGGTDAADQGKNADKNRDELAPLLPAPCDIVGAVLPACSNPFCINLEGDSEAGLQLVACGGRCGGKGCGGEGPCCCRRCATGKQAAWQAVLW